MIELMFDTISYEIGGNYFGFSAGFGDLFYTPGRMIIEKKSKDFASWYAARERIANGVINDFYKKLDKIEG